MSRKIANAPTSFARWRTMMQLTQAQAAELLDKSRRSIVGYETADPPVKVDYCTRVVMQLLTHGDKPIPWPE
jgi:DNA-binding XRE family transcriptional regulator